MAYYMVLKSIAFIVLSVAIGFGYFYLISPSEWGAKKKQLDETVSLLINFVIYMWLGKIVVNLSTFINDPIAVLAYPSNAKAFYVATIFLIINIIYKNRRSNLQIKQYLYLFVAIFITSTFTYEFLQWNINGVRHNLWLLIFITIILLVVTLNRNMTERFTINTIFVIFIGLIIISFFSPLMTFFGYILSPIYYLLFLVLFTIYIYRQKRKV